MCGRFTQKSERKIIADEFYVQQFLEEPSISYNVAPGQKAGIIIRNNGNNTYDKYKWGLIPPWAKDPSIGNKMINARGETLLSKPSFKRPFLNKRCVIPVNGFFEWKKEGKYNVPYYIFHKSDKPFALAGLWDEWTNPKADDNKNQTIRTFTIITIDSLGSFKDIHSRIPAIISRDIINTWLENPAENKNNISKLEKILFESTFDNLDFYQVSKFVNSPANNDPQCIEPINR